MKTYSVVAKITEICVRNYSEQTFKHCLRVANYVIDNPCLQSDDEKEFAFIIALCHDLLEDTNVTVEEITSIIGYDEDFINFIMDSLTKKKDETYIDYIKRLKLNMHINKSYCYSYIPYVVKLADMKDHLTQTETLTDKLKEKYWEALPYLL